MDGDGDGELEGAARWSQFTLQGQLMAQSYSVVQHRLSLLQQNFDALASWGVHPLNGSSSSWPHGLMDVLALAGSHRHLALPAATVYEALTWNTTNMSIDRSQGGNKNIYPRKIIYFLKSSDMLLIVKIYLIAPNYLWKLWLKTPQFSWFSISSIMHTYWSSMY